MLFSPNDTFPTVEFITLPVPAFAIATEVFPKLNAVPLLAIVWPLPTVYTATASLIPVAIVPPVRFTFPPCEYTPTPEFPTVIVPPVTSAAYPNIAIPCVPTVIFPEFASV